MTELMIQYLNEASSVFDLTMMKVQALCEATERQLAINLNEAELKVMQESGTDDDLAYLTEEANKSYNETISRTIDKILSSLSEFYNKIQTKIVALVKKKETADTVDKIEKKIKIFPLFGKKKATIENTDAQLKVCDEAMSKLSKLEAKAASGQDVTNEQVIAILKEFNEKHSKAAAVSSSISVTSSKAFALMKERMSKLSSSTSSTYNDAKSRIEKTKKINAGVASSFARAFATIAKTKMNDIVRGVSDLSIQIKKAFNSGDAKAETKEKDKKGLIDKVKEKFTKESSDDIDDGGTPPTDAEQEAISKTLKEEGPVDDADACPGGDCGPAEDPLDALDKVDPWASVMGDLPVSVPGQECGPEGCDSEGCKEANCNENATDSFDAIYKKIFGDAAPSPSDDAALKENKPNNDKMIADLYKDVMAEVQVKGKNPEVKPIKPLKEGIGVESVFDTLMEEIKNL